MNDSEMLQRIFEEVVGIKGEVKGLGKTVGGLKATGIIFG